MNSKAVLLLIQFLLAIFSSSLIEGNEIILTQSELKAKYGQGTKNSTKIWFKNSPKILFSADTIFNDGKSCYRTCVAGQTKTCYFEFDVQPYDTMSG